MNSILANVIKNFKQIGEETVENVVDNTGKIVSGIITGTDLVGIKPKSEQDLNKIRAEEANKKQDEEKIKQEYMGQGRNVEQEIGQIRDEGERKEEEEEKFLSNLERQRENERIEREQMQAEVPGNAKKEAAKRQGQRGHKKHAPDPVAMSATGEKSGGID